jgi:hypothetical protein
VGPPAQLLRTASGCALRDALLRGLPGSLARPSFAAQMPGDVVRVGAIYRHVRRPCAVVWLVIAACTSTHDRSGPPGVGAHLDSSAPSPPVEGTGTSTSAAPSTRTSPAAAPATKGPPAPVSPAGPGASPAAESARVIGQRFEAARGTANAAAISLDTLPPSARFTAAYAARFDSIRALTRHADSLRTARDRWRKKAAR